MAQRNRKVNAPGKSHRNGIRLKGLIRIFPDNATSERWFHERIWKGLPCCANCGSTKVNRKAKHPTMPHRCREKGCYKYFSVKTGTVMEASNISHRDWAIAIYLYNTNLKGISSMRLHRELELRQSTAWFILKRLRKADESGIIRFADAVEVDETYIGGKTHRMNRKQYVSWKKKTGGGRGATGKIPVACIREKSTGRVQYEMLPDTKSETLKQFVVDRTESGCEVQTDQLKGYVGLDKLNRIHETVNHKEYQFAIYKDGKVITTNGCESNFASLKATIIGVFHHISVKHLPCYLNEASGKRNRREFDTMDQMGEHAFAMVGKRIKFVDLTARTPEQEEAYAARNYDKFGLERACYEAAGFPDQSRWQS